MAAQEASVQDRLSFLTQENADLRKRISADITEDRQRHFAELVKASAPSQGSEIETHALEERARLQEELSSAKLQVSELRSSLHSQEVLLKRNDDELSRLYSSNNNLENTISSWREENLRVAQERDVLAAQLESSRGSVSTEVATLKKQLDQRQLKEESLILELQQKETQLETLQTELSCFLSAKDAEAMGKLLAAKDATITSLNGKLEIAETAQKTERNVFNQKLNRLTDDLQQKVVDLSEKVQHLETRNEALNKELSQTLPYKARVLADPETYGLEVDAVASAAGGNSPMDAEGASQVGSPASRMGGQTNQFPSSSGSPSFRGRVSKRGRDTNGRLADAAAAFEPVTTDGPDARKHHLRLKVQQQFGGSAKQKCLDFWTEGHRKIEELEAEQLSLKRTIQQFETKEEEVKKILLDRQKTIVSLAALTEEVQKQREELTQCRATMSGLEVSKEFLTKQLHDLIGSEMTINDLRSSVCQIEEGAATAAKASGSVLFDEGAMKKAMKEKQVLTQETAHLQREKDKLLSFIQQREQRLESLTANLGSRLIAHESILIEAGNGKQQFKLDIHQLTEIMKELSSPYSQSGSAPIDGLLGKQKIIECQMRIKALQEEGIELRKEISSSRILLEAEKAETKLATGPLEEKVEELKTESTLVSGSNIALTRKSAALVLSNTTLTERVQDLLGGSQMVRNTSLAVVDLLGKELQTSKRVKEELLIKQQKISELEARLGIGSDDDESVAVAAWGKVSDESARLLQEALVRHVSAMEAQLAFQISTVKEKDSLHLKAATELLRQKDSAITVQSQKAIESYKKLSHKIDELTKQKSQKEGMLLESQRWAAQCESQISGLKLRLEEANRQHAFFGANHVKTLFASSNTNLPATATSTSRPTEPPTPFPIPTALKNLSEVLETPAPNAVTFEENQQNEQKQNPAPTVPLRTTSAITNSTLVVNEGTEDHEAPAQNDDEVVSEENPSGGDEDDETPAFE